MVMIEIVPQGRGRYLARLLSDGRAVVDGDLCISGTPLLTAARKLLALGQCAGKCLSMRHVGSDCVSIRTTIGTAAGLAVFEGRHYGPRLVPYRPVQFSGACPRLRPRYRAGERVHVLPLTMMYATDSEQYSEGECVGR